MSTYRDTFPTNPFDNAYFSRTSDAEKLDKIIEIYKGEIVIALTSPWGNGKTWFLESYRRKLEDGGYKVFSYNAWENELADSPFISFSSYLYGYLKKNDAVLIEQAKNEKLLDSIKNIVKYIIPVALKLLIGTKIDIDKLGKVGEQAIESLSEYSKSIYEDSVKKDEQVLNFKNAINESILRICSNSKPLIIIIDELDRCCPIYAINFLETLKHFFDVKNVVYILAIDKDMLCESIKHVYGEGIDPDGFLRKIINIQYKLRNGDDIYGTSHYAVLNDIISNDRTSQQIKYRLDLKSCSLLLKHYNVPIRTIRLLMNTIYNAIEINKNISDGFPEIPDFIFFFYLVKSKDPDIFNAIFIERDIKYIIQIARELKEITQLVTRDAVVKYLFPITCLVDDIQTAIKIKESVYSEEEYPKKEFIDLYNTFGKIIKKYIGFVSNIELYF